MLDYEHYEALMAGAEQQGWPSGYFANTYGALADDPIERPVQDMFEVRASLL